MDAHERAGKRDAMQGLSYLYAILPAEFDLAAMHPVSGIDGALLARIVEGKLQAVYSTVAATDWEAGILDQCVQNMDWLAPRATRHQEVVRALHEASPALLPLPFATIYRAVDAIAELLRAREHELRQSMEQLWEVEEWTLRVYQDGAHFESQLAAVSPSVAAAQAALDTASPGRAFLLRKQLQTLQHTELKHATERVADEIVAHVAGVARAVHREPVVGRRGDSEARDQPGTQLMLKLALLVERPRRDEADAALSTTLARYTDLGLRYEVTGPWPPYSFVSPVAEMAP